MTVQQVNVTFRTSYSGAGTQAFQRDLNTLSGSMQKVAATSGQSFQRFGRFAQAAGTALMVGVGAALAVGIKASIDFESAFAGVRKVLDASEGTFQNLAMGIREMALEIPVAATELARIGELGGQLGIPVNALEDFIRVIAELGVTTNLETDEAATSIARFVEVMGTSDDEFENVASSIVELGNNFATTEKEILAFGGRLTGIGSTIGLTEGDVLGLATAFTALGEPAERGSTAVQRAFTSMFEAVSQGGDDLALFAEILGITSQEFITLFEEDPAQAFVQFSEGLGTIIDNGGDVVSVLQELGLGSQRALAAMLKAASGSEVIAEAVLMGNEAYAENVALSEEAEKRFGTMASQLTILRNNFTDLSISIGDKAAPAFKDILGFTGSFFDILRENMVWLEIFLGLVIALAGAKGLLALGRTFAGVLTGLGEMSIKMTGVGVAGLNMSDKLARVAGGVRAFGGVIALAALAVGAIATAFARNRQHADEYEAAIRNLAETTERYNEGTATANDLTDALGTTLAQKTGIFDFTVDLEDNTELLHDLGISVNQFATLAITDVEKFDERMRGILKGKFGLDDDTITTLFENGFQIPEIRDSNLVGQFGQDRQELEQFLTLLRETEAATAALREEERLLAKERELEMLPLIGEAGGEPIIGGATDWVAAGSGLPGTLGTAVQSTSTEYADALAQILLDSAEFGSDFAEEWEEIVAEFNSNLFDWETAWDEYEQAPKISTRELTKSIDNWVADQKRLSTALAFVYTNMGEEIGEFFTTLPIDLQRGLAATLAESGPEAFTNQINTLTDAWGELMTLSFENALTMAPTGARRGLDAWVDFLDNELGPTLEEHGPVGSQRWIDGVIQGFASFKGQLLDESPEMALAFDEMLTAAVEQIDADIEIIDVQAAIADLTTAEKILYFQGLGLDWATAIALGFAALPAKLGEVANKAVARVNNNAARGWGIKSPSKVAAHWGKMIGIGFQQGLDQAMPMPFQHLTKVPSMGPQPSTSSGMSRDTHITIVNPQHKDDDVLDGVKRASTLVGLTRYAEVTPGFN